jgi:hypothetical protein
MRQKRIKNNESQYNTQHADKTQTGSCAHKAVLIFSDGPDQFRKNDTRAQIIADICKIDIKVARELHVEKTCASDTCRQSECTIERLIHKLCSPVF